MEYYPHLKHQCCRLKTQVSESTLVRIIANAELNESNIYPSQDKGDFMQFDMTNETDGYPCIHLGENGCNIHETKPESCSLFPLEEENIKFSVGCSYVFDENGNRSGTCNGCSIV